MKSSQLGDPHIKGHNMNRLPNNPRLNLALGGALGATALVAFLLAFSGGVSAQDASLAVSATEATAVDGTELSEDDPVLDDAWAAYDACLGENGINVMSEMVDIQEGEVGEDTGFVFVQDADQTSYAAFGEGDATITITKEGDVINVEGSGDVEIDDPTDHIEAGGDQEWDAEWEQAHQACEGELPDDAFFVELMDEAVPFDMVESEAVEVPADS